MSRSVCTCVLLLTSYHSAGAGECHISARDLRLLFGLHAEALKTVRPDIPAMAEIRRNLPVAIAGKDVECLSPGPFRIIHPVGSMTIYILDAKRAAQRWDMRGVLEGRPWTTAVTLYAKDYLQTSSATLQTVLRRPPFTEAEKKVLIDLSTGVLPRTTKIRLRADLPATNP